jgi:hypothetical protein
LGVIDCKTSICLSSAYSFIAKTSFHRRFDFTMAASANEKPGCLSIFLPFLGRSKKKATAEALPYRLRDDFLSPAEFSFYKVLSSLVGTHLTIQSKVRLAVLSPSLH